LLLFTAQLFSQSRFINCSAWVGFETKCRPAEIDKLYRLDSSLMFRDERLEVRYDPAQVKTPLTPARADSLLVQGLKTAVRRYNGRLVWTFFVGLSTITAWTALGIAALLLTGAVGERRVRFHIRLGFVLVSATAVGIGMWRTPWNHMSLMWSVLGRTIDGNIRYGAIDSARQVMNRVNSFEQAAAVAMILACCWMLLPTPAPKSTATLNSTHALERRLEPILHRQRNLNLFLYAGTIFLIVGVLRMQAVGEWALTFVLPQDADVLKPITMTASVAMGAFFQWCSRLLICLPHTSCGHARPPSLACRA
jgi:hypothetical protein